MSRKRTIRAWKDPAFRGRLSAAERAAMPANPAGTVSLDDADLGFVAGGTGVTCDLATDHCGTCTPTFATAGCVATANCGTCDTCQLTCAFATAQCGTCPC